MNLGSIQLFLLDSLWLQKGGLGWEAEESAGIQLVDLLVHELEEEE